MGDVFRIALANIRFPADRNESITLATEAIRQAGVAEAAIICFPECFVPGYRRPGASMAPADAAFLEQAWSTIAAAAGEAGVGVVLGTERVVHDTVLASALVVNADGTVAGFQDKVQIDPSEEGTYAAGCGRRVFHAV